MGRGRRGQASSRGWAGQRKLQPGTPDTVKVQAAYTQVGAHSTKLHALMMPTEPSGGPVWSAPMLPTAVIAAFRPIDAGAACHKLSNSGTP
jgi:hypothetical protein